MHGSLVLRQLFEPSSSIYPYLLGDRVTGQVVIIDAVFEQHLRDLALIRELGLTLVASLGRIAVARCIPLDELKGRLAEIPRDLGLPVARGAQGRAT
jgi:hypothetical protein